MDTKAIDFEVVREPLFTADRTATGHDAIIRTDTGKVMSVVSKQYQLLTHKTAWEKANQAISGIGYGMELKKLDVNKAGTKMFLHMASPLGYDLGGGDVINPTLVLINSMDGSTMFGFKIGAFRLVCSNGMIRGIAFQNISMRHTSGSDFGGIIDAAGAAMRNFNEESIPRWQRMMKRELPKSPELIVNDFQNSKMAIPDKVNKGVLNRLVEYGARTSWDLYNHYTHVLSHDYQSSVERTMYISGAVERVLGNL